MARSDNNRKRKSKNRSVAQLGFEKLESRELLTGISLVDGTLLISGRNVAERSVVTQNGATVTATLTGFANESFAADDVDLIRFVGRDGNDTFVNSTNIQSRAFGNAGNDRLFGGSNRDFIVGGNDNDTIDGRDGNDRISGSAGNDVLRGGGNRDVISGGAGNDTISGDLGFDVINGNDGNDISVYASAFSTYELSARGNAVVFNSPAGEEVNQSIETFRFADGDRINNNPNDPNSAPSNTGASNTASGNTTTGSGSTGAVTPPPAAANPSNTNGFNDAELASLDLLNSFRASNGRAELAANSDLSEFAESWSRTQGQSNRLFHSAESDRLDLARQTNNTLIGENIAFVSNIGQSLEEVGQQLHDLWINSPVHRANMLNGNFDQVGVGIVLGADNRWYGTHVFAG